MTKMLGKCEINQGRIKAQKVINELCKNIKRRIL